MLQNCLEQLCSPESVGQRQVAFACCVQVVNELSGPCPVISVFPGEPLNGQEELGPLLVACAPNLALHREPEFAVGACLPQLIEGLHILNGDFSDLHVQESSRQSFEQAAA